MIILPIFLKIPIRYKITWLPAFAWLVVMLACKEMCARMSVIFGYYYVVMLRIKIDCCTENYFDRFIDVNGWLKGKKSSQKLMQCKSECLGTAGPSKDTWNWWEAEVADKKWKESCQRHSRHKLAKDKDILFFVLSSSFLSGVSFDIGKK